MKPPGKFLLAGLA